MVLGVTKVLKTISHLVSDLLHTNGPGTIGVNTYGWAGFTLKPLQKVLANLKIVLRGVESVLSGCTNWLHTMVGHTYRLYRRLITAFELRI